MKRSIVLSFVVAMLAFGCKKDEPAAAAAAPAAAAPSAMAPAAAAPATAAPAAAAGGGGSCAAYARCCTAVSALPNMQAMSAACAQVQQLTALGPQGEAACAQALGGLRTGLSAMPGGAPAACN